ncbi:MULTISPECIES: c-type cytochrome [Cohnella]|uniref:c-type cytochrome n=1 Tax=Cohnella TaxID=329857 RepID=UPI0009BC5488|nr:MULTISPECIES: cytochrome c [Cohnella]MBN2982050.1 c-type cytochrome [Cohnella algarum]
MVNHPCLSQPRAFKKIAAVASAVGLAVILAACGKGGSTAAPSGSPVEGPEETLILYRDNCVSCHGADLAGKMGDPSDLRNVGDRLTREQIREQIVQGGDLMPAFGGRLTDEEIDALAAWLANR